MVFPFFPFFPFFSIEPKQTEDPPKQIEREYIWVIFRKFRVVSVCYETVLFVSVNRNFLFLVSRNKPETDLVSVCFGSNLNFFWFVLRTP
jgi:hypothetical protein